MGAGFIGCIIMEALKARGVRLTVVEAGDRMVPRMMDQVAGNMIKQWCMDKGIDVRTSTRVVQVRRSAAGLRLWRAPAGRPAGGGHRRTSQHRLDVCEGADWFGGQGVHAIQPMAVETARVAAMNMCGREANHVGSMDMNVLDTLGLIAISYGRWMGVEGGDTASRLNQAENRYIKLQFDGDRLVGAITLGLTPSPGWLEVAAHGRSHPLHGSLGGYAGLMSITFKLYASLMDYLPREARGHAVTLEVPEGTSPIQVLEQHGVPLAEVHLVLVNGVFVPPSQRQQPLQAGDVLAVWPAVAGG